MSMSDYKESEFGLSVFLLVNTILDQEALRQLVRVNTAHRTGRELCPQWTPLRIWYGRSSSCSCVWPWCRHTARRPPWWAARWRSLADRRQTPSYNLEGGLLWREGEGLFESSGTGERTYRYICVCVCVCVNQPRQGRTEWWKSLWLHLRWGCTNNSRNDSVVPERRSLLMLSMNYALWHAENNISNGKNVAFWFHRCLRSCWQTRGAGLISSRLFSPKKYCVCLIVYSIKDNPNNKI